MDSDSEESDSDAEDWDVSLEIEAAVREAGASVLLHPRPSDDDVTKLMINLDRSKISTSAAFRAVASMSQVAGRDISTLKLSRTSIHRRRNSDAAKPQCQVTEGCERCLQKRHSLWNLILKSEVPDTQRERRQDHFGLPNVNVSLAQSSRINSGDGNYFPGVAWERDARHKIPRVQSSWESQGLLIHNIVRQYTYKEEGRLADFLKAVGHNFTL
ncbi:tRNA (guanine(37)-N1)-methyltransferase [Frankliniella fusca]|uniref:tRNA (Guanine(37)-N1)-methyltransferase n=1 Tax=Frankliniella fusca TaxID=407009 RepID=A0AAE1GVB0_9NEOP|nr:tRNA (guanine(37)-N1)-methyltransferase [Frankliniella fusca]